MKILKYLIMPVFIFSSFLSFSQEDTLKRKPPRIKLTTNISLGLNYVSGNTNKFGTNTSVKISAKDSIREMTLSGSYIINRTNRILDQREVNSGFQYDFLPLSIISPFASVNVYSNTFQKINVRTSGLAGIKYTYLNNLKSEYSISAAFLADIEKYTSDIDLPVQEKYRISIRVKFKQTLWENVFINHETFYIPLLSSFDDYRIQSNTSINIRINRVITLNFSYNFDYNNKPISEEVKKSDNKLYTNLLFTF